MSRKSLSAMFVTLAVANFAGCDDDDDEGVDGGTLGNVDGGDMDAHIDWDAVGPISYWQTVAPIFFGKCVSCHQQGGIGPFRLDDPATASTWAGAIVQATRTDHMPPFHMTHDGTCGDYQDAETLTASEKQLIRVWAEGAKAVGTPATLQVPAKPALTGATDFKTPMFKPERGKIMPAALGQFDEYRCFLIEPGIATDKFITGYNVVPGSAAIVHHVLAFVVDPIAKSRKKKPNSEEEFTNAEVMTALDGIDPERDGWPCFSDAGEGTDLDAVAVSWAPGQGVINYPAGTGMRLKKTDKVVIQVHYNLADDKNLGMMDSTMVRLRLEDSVQQRLISVFPDTLLESLAKPIPDLLPPGQASYKYIWKKNMTALGLEGLPPVQVVGVMPHMHERGRKWELRFGTAADPGTCVGEVKQWDFAWQRMYFFRTPPMLTSTSVVQLTCDYNTAGDTQPVIPGWGTRNEMCLAVMIVALPPGF
jgi:hypothetical protein